MMSVPLLKPIFGLSLAVFCNLLYSDDKDKPIRFRGLEEQAFTIDGETPLLSDQQGNGMKVILERLQSRFYDKYDFHNNEANQWREINMTPVFSLIRQIEAMQTELWKKYGKESSDFRVPGNLCGGSVRLREVEFEMSEVDQRINLAEGQKKYFRDKPDRIKEFQSWSDHETRLVELRTDLSALKWKIKDLQRGISVLAGNLVKLEIPGTPSGTRAPKSSCLRRFGVVAESSP